MANAAKPIAQGYHTLNVYISVKGADRAFEFYKVALGAEEIYRFAMPDGMDRPRGASDR
jgi:PhnB protein